MRFITNLIILISFFANAQHDCIVIRNSLTGEKLDDSFLSVYSSEQPKLFYANKKSLICLDKKQIVEADSLVINVNFQKFSVSKRDALSGSVSVLLSNDLEEVYINTKKKVFEYGPDRPYGLPHTTVASNRIHAVGFEIDSISSGRTIKGLRIRFRGSGLFIPQRSYQSQISIQLYHADNRDFDGIHELLTIDENNLHIIDFRGAGWLKIDLSFSDIHIPDSGYFIMAFQVKKGEVVFSSYKGSKNESFDYLRNDNRAEKGKIFRVVDGLDLPAIRLELY